MSSASNGSSTNSYDGTVIGNPTLSSGPHAVTDIGFTVMEDWAATESTQGIAIGDIDGDDNQDSFIDALDAIFDRLVLWQDADTDGVSDAGELLGLQDAGITRIDLDATSSLGVDNGNVVFQTGEYATDDGGTGAYVEVALDIEQQQAAA